MSKTGMMAAVAAAAGIGDEPIEVTAELVAEHFPAVAESLRAEGAEKHRAEGAEAERKRLAGIEAQAMPGHEAIVAAHKADPAKTGADTAMAIVAAEKKQRASMTAQLDQDEQSVKGLRSEPANGAGGDDGASRDLSGEALWKADYARSADLQAEFGTVERYVGFKTLEAQGRIRTTAKG